MSNIVMKPLSPGGVPTDFVLKVPQAVISAFNEAAKESGFNSAEEAAAQALTWFVEKTNCGRRIIRVGGMPRPQRKRKTEEDLLNEEGSKRKTITRKPVAKKPTAKKPPVSRKAKTALGKAPAKKAAKGRKTVPPSRKRKAD